MNIGRHRVTCLLFGWLAVVAARAAHAQEPVTVPLSDPSRPGTLTVAIVQGTITVKGANRTDVVVVPRPRSARSPRWNEPDATGLRRLTPSTGFKVVEEFNEIRVAALNPNHALDFEIQVPTRTHLKLSTVNSSEISVEGIEGNLEISNTNGNITLTQVSGAVIAHTTNGNVLATLLRVSPEKAMAFRSLNGRIDVTLPAATKANLKLRSDNGDVYTDFPLTLQPSPAPAVRESRRDRGRFEIRRNSSIYGSINGGGPDIELRTFNSNVYVRKGR